MWYIYTRSALGLCEISPQKLPVQETEKVYEDYNDSNSDNDDRYDTDDTDDETSHSTIETSPWYSATEKIKNLTEGKPVIVYLRDVEQVVEVFHDSGIKAAKYVYSW